MKRMIPVLIMAVLGLFTTLLAFGQEVMQFAPITFTSQQILAAANFDFTGPLSGIYTLNLDGSEKRLIAHLGKTNSDLRPSASRGGRRIAFHSDNGTNAFGAYLYDTATGEVTLIPYTKWTDIGVISPDGLKFASMFSDLYLVDLETGNAIWTKGTHGGQLAWTPDGTEIIDANAVEGVYAFSASDGTRRAITQTPFRQAPDDTIEMLCISPSGKKVAFIFATGAPGETLMRDYVYEAPTRGGPSTKLFEWNRQKYGITATMAYYDEDRLIIGARTQPDPTKVQLLLVDKSGNVLRELTPRGTWSMWPSVFDPDDYRPWDVKNDGLVDIQDLVTVALRFGQTGNPGWIYSDTNLDGLVDIQDLVIVALHFGETVGRYFGGPAAPSLTLGNLKEQLLKAKTEEEVLWLLRDFIPQVKSKSKLPTTWANLKTK